MEQLIIYFETYIRITAFFSILIIMMLWEQIAPRRQLHFSRFKRWANNLALVFFNTIVLRLLFPTLVIGIAIVAKQQGWGLFNNFITPYPLTVILSVIALDFVIYLQHVMFHFLPLFWRLHRMHHTDLDIDVTTGLRFHPFEILLSMLIKIAAVVSLGAPALAVIIFEIYLNATSMFNHSNIKLPLKLDKLLRWLIVTPDMHRVHHSVIPQETNSNFGFNLPWWDRLLGTYKAQPQMGHTDMTIGLNIFRDPKYLGIEWLLIVPFLGKITTARTDKEK